MGRGGGGEQTNIQGRKSKKQEIKWQGTFYVHVV